jgi:hypothetical protein
MVKVDIKRDYYADLGLSPSTEPDEIKKQFRRLGERLPILICSPTWIEKEAHDLYVISSAISIKVSSRSKSWKGSRVQGQISSHPVST